MGHRQDMAINAIGDPKRMFATFGETITNRLWSRFYFSEPAV